MRDIHFHFPAYKNTYGTEPVWVPYRRNFKGQIPPYKTRTNCVVSIYLRDCSVEIFLESPDNAGGASNVEYFLFLQGDNGFLRTGNPCPICRDEYLVVHYKNVELLKQFISPQHGGTYPSQ